MLELIVLEKEMEGFPNVSQTMARADWKSSSCKTTHAHSLLLLRPAPFRVCELQNKYADRNSS